MRPTIAAIMVAFVTQAHASPVVTCDRPIQELFELLVNMPPIRRLLTPPSNAPLYRDPRFRKYLQPQRPLPPGLPPPPGLLDRYPGEPPGWQGSPPPVTIPDQPGPPPPPAQDAWRRKLIEEGRRFCDTYPGDPVCSGNPRP